MSSAAYRSRSASRITIVTPSGSGCRRSWRALQLLGQQPVGVGGAGAGIDQVDDEPQSFQLVARVHALRALAPRRDHDAVAFLPRPKRRRLDAEHAGDRPDRVDRPAAQTRLPHQPRSRSRALRPHVQRRRRARSASTSRITHRDGFTIDSLAPRARQAAWMATNSRRPDGVDERQPGTVQLDVAVHPGEPGPDLRHAGERRARPAAAASPAVPAPTTNIPGSFGKTSEETSQECCTSSTVLARLSRKRAQTSTVPVSRVEASVVAPRFMAPEALVETTPWGGPQLRSRRSFMVARQRRRRPRRPPPRGA